MDENPYEAPQNAVSDPPPEQTLRERLAKRNKALVYAMAVPPGLFAVGMTYFMAIRIRQHGVDDVRVELPVYLVMGLGVALFGAIAAVLIWRAGRIGGRAH